MTFKRWYTIEDAKQVLHLTTNHLVNFKNSNIFPVKQTIDTHSMADPYNLQDYKWGQVYSFWEIAQMYTYVTLQGNFDKRDWRRIRDKLITDHLWECLLKKGLDNPVKDNRDLILNISSSITIIYREDDEPFFYRKGTVKGRVVKYRRLFERINYIFPEYIAEEKPGEQKCPKCNLGITATYLKEINFFIDLTHTHVLCPKCGANLFIDATRKVLTEKITIHAIRAPREDEDAIYTA